MRVTIVRPDLLAECQRQWTPERERMRRRKAASDSMTESADVSRRILDMRLYPVVGLDARRPLDDDRLLRRQTLLAQSSARTCRAAQRNMLARMREGNPAGCLTGRILTLLRYGILDTHQIAERLSADHPAVCEALLRLEIALEVRR
jgi:hypothetical protein